MKIEMVGAVAKKTILYGLSDRVEKAIERGCKACLQSAPPVDARGVRLRFTGAT